MVKIPSLRVALQKRIEEVGDAFSIHFLRCAAKNTRTDGSRYFFAGKVVTSSSFAKAYREVGDVFSKHPIASETRTDRATFL